MTTRHGIFRHALLLLALALGMGLAGCEGDDGAAGTDGTDGVDGTDGAAGQACWDLNNNGVGDADEDINGDGTVDVFDCNAYASGAYAIDQLHAGYFTEHPYEGTRSCLNCHGKLADEVLQTAHFKWEGIATNLEGVETEIHGKNDILNNFCIAVPSNEGRCTQCHAGYNYRDDTYDFGDPENIDCLVCHDQTATYAKAPTTAGLPDPTVDLGAVARSVAMNGGQPTIENCIDCHANAGGGDNVKHGDISMSMADTTREYDVHMGTDGGNMECVACHQVQRDADGNMLSHGIGGMPYHSVDEGVMRQCDDCHGDLNNIHIGTTVELVFSNNRHQRLACQVCHIPTFARNTSTKVEWYWETAGQVIDPIPVDPATGRPTYDQKKGDFVWANNVRPELRFFNGKYRKMLIGDNNDTYVAEPVTLAEPMGDYTDPAAMIYPFKRMIGNQVADVVNQRIMVPHLFGMSGGPNPYWARYDWDLALLDASAITGQPYQSGDYGFVDTEMFLSINHEVAPAEQAWGMDANCGDCHLSGQIDWAALGWTNDPAIDGVRP
ncbi:MAG: tetrathionate reductase family octaheme c-type cytochrome [Gammaproteobacteria bacterium]|nr:tetrathionate reductase family octaheme c-type cytochrome [Gammaproteobacteria bacterium]